MPFAIKHFTRYLTVNKMHSAWDVSLLCQEICVLSLFSRYSHLVLTLVQGYFYTMTMIFLGVNFYLFNHYCQSWDFFSLWNLCCVSLVSFDVNALEVYDELDNLSLEGFFHISSFHLCRQLNELIHIDNVCISYILRSCLIKQMLDACYIDIYHIC